MFREFAIARVRLDDEHDAMVAQSWLTAKLTQSKIPELQTLLAKRHRPTADLRPQLHALAEHYGLKVRTRKKSKR